MVAAVLVAVALGSPMKTIAATQHDSYRVTIVAFRNVTDKVGPRASVRITEARDGKPLGTLLVGQPDGFFWYPLTGPSSVRYLRFGAAGRVSFQLLITPSVGWSRTYRFRIVNGTLTHS